MLGALLVFLFVRRFGVKAVEVNDAKTTNAPVQIYTVNGQRVNNMLPGQVYILKKGNKTIKVVK